VRDSVRSVPSSKVIKHGVANCTKIRDKRTGDLIEESKDLSKRERCPSLSFPKNVIDKVVLN
jgi:hypothetical protein